VCCWGFYLVYLILKTIRENDLPNLHIQHISRVRERTQCACGIHPQERVSVAFSRCQVLIKWFPY
jgi:hypothetical protein